MRLRGRLLAASFALVVAPLALVAVLVRAEMGRRLEDQYRRRAGALSAVVAAELAARSRELGERLAGLSDAARRDDALRRALEGGGGAGGPVLLDWAPRAMRISGLSVLELSDPGGRVLSSGQFRNDFGRDDSGLAERLAAIGPRAAVARARRPEGDLLVFARVDSFRVGGAAYRLVGGWALDRDALAGLAKGGEPAVSLVYPGGALSSDPEIERRLAAPAPDAARALPPREFLVQELTVPMIGPTREEAAAGTASILVLHPLAAVSHLRARLDRWLLLLVGGAAGGTLLVSAWLSSRVSRPIEELARKTTALDLEHLDAEFPAGGGDEVGTLARFLGEMARRLRGNVAALREAERRAALGDLARQVHHDIQSGFVPIRNVVRHLASVARDDPAGLPALFRERQPTIEGAIGYLEGLAANTARLAPPGALVPCSLSEIVRGAGLEHAAGAGSRIRIDAADDLPVVLADPAGLRRVVENLVRNGRESLVRGEGSVTVTTSSGVDAGGRPVARLVVEDTGCGIEPERLDRLFEGFASTKAGGSGLGLVIVRRLVGDYGGDVRVASEPGRGTRVTVTLPAAATRGARDSDRPERAA